MIWKLTWKCLWSLINYSTSVSTEFLQNIGIGILLYRWNTNFISLHGISCCLPSRMVFKSRVWMSSEVRTDLVFSMTHEAIETCISCKFQITETYVPVVHVLVVACLSILIKVRSCTCKLVEDILVVVHLLVSRLSILVINIGVRCE